MANTIEWDPIIAIHNALWMSGESQRDLATKLGWDEARLSKILSRKQRLLVSDLTQIARAQNRQYDWYLEPPTANEAKGVSGRWFRLAEAV